MRKTSLIIVAVLAVVVTVGLGLAALHQLRRGPRANVSEFESDCTEALVRGILRELGIRNAPVCFLGFGEGRTPPSRDFIARFSDCRRPAVRSLGSAVAPPIGRFLEISNGRPGVILQIIQSKEYLPGTFDVTVVVSILPPGHNRVIYRVSKTGGEWKITNRTAT